MKFKLLLESRPTTLSEIRPQSLSDLFANDKRNCKGFSMRGFQCWFVHHSTPSDIVSVSESFKFVLNLEGLGRTQLATSFCDVMWMGDYMDGRFAMTRAASLLLLHKCFLMYVIHFAFLELLVSLTGDISAIAPGEPVSRMYRALKTPSVILVVATHITVGGESVTLSVNDSTRTCDMRVGFCRQANATTLFFTVCTSRMLPS
jgi:hypothetical protein